MSKIFVTGNEGFVGKYLVKALKERGDEVMGYDIVNKQDICHYPNLVKSLEKFKPDEIYHLAAEANVARSLANPQVAILVNVIGTVNLLQAVKDVCPDASLLITSTGDAPSLGSPYAISKLSMEYFIRFYADLYKLKIVLTRAHSHIGPGQSTDYAIAKFAAKIKKGGTLTHGNLASMRNFTDVRDIVKAYLVAMEEPTGFYEICSDRNVTMQSAVDLLIKLAGTKVNLVPDKSLYRPAGNYMAPKCTLPGWKPEISLEQTFKDMLA